MRYSWRALLQHTAVHCARMRMASALRLNPEHFVYVFKRLWYKVAT